MCFDAVRVIVPCGNGELTVTELIERAVSRYRKATNKASILSVYKVSLSTVKHCCCLNSVLNCLALVNFR